MIFFRGWGWMVFFLGIGCFVAGLVGLYTLEPGAAVHTGAQSTTDGWRALALGLVVEAPIVWVIAFNRDRTAPGHDQFCYIPLKSWPPILVALAIAAFIASFFGAYLPAW